MPSGPQARIAKDGMTVRKGQVTVYNRIVEFLEKNGESNSRQILDFINTYTNYNGRPTQRTATMQQIGNILGKYRRFRRTGMEYRGGSTGAATIHTWELVPLEDLQ